jgi:hypothetical protein
LQAHREVGAIPRDDAAPRHPAQQPECGLRRFTAALQVFALAEAHGLRIRGDDVIELVKQLVAQAEALDRGGAEAFALL